MTTFDDMQHAWNQQSGSGVRPSQPEEVIVLAEKNTRQIKAKQFWTIGILGLSILLFSGYILVYTGLRFSWFHAGISLMFFSLLLRLIMEYRSYTRFRRIDIRADFTNYAKGITTYYSNRRKIHYIITPITYCAYTIGFLILLPVFKQSFSAGFFWYIIISGGSFLILFMIMLIRQVKKEMRLLDYLKEVG